MTAKTSGRPLDKSTHLQSQVFVAQNWPTPRASDGNHGGPNQRDSAGNPGLSAAVHMWPTPKTPTGGGQVERNTPGGGIRKLEDAISQTVGYNTGQLNADWVEILMGFPVNWTNIDCDDPQDWPGWPAPPGAGMWHTPRANKFTGLAGRGFSPTLMDDILHTDKHGQYPYEPPRVVAGQKHRAKRLKCVGNAVSPEQVEPIFAAIAAIERGDGHG